MRNGLARFIRDPFLPAVLNSYSVVFFFNSRIAAVMLLVVTFFNFPAGLSGLIAVISAVLIADATGFDRKNIRQGLYSFNALLAGICLGTFYQPGIVYFVILLLVSLLTLFLSVVLGGWLGKKGLPFLSLPFVLSVWVVILPSSQLVNLGLTQRNIFWINELYSVGGEHLLNFFQTIDNLPFSRMVDVYFRSLSSILFQDNLLAGILIAVTILISSRIAFMLSVVGFVTAFIFARFVGADMVSFSFYNIGANYILVALAAGGFLTIPSRSSFLWAVILVPLTSLLILFASKLLGSSQLPVFSLPFSVITIIFIWFLTLRERPGSLSLTIFQNYSPEINLYSHLNSIDRSAAGNFFPLHLPFWGEWRIMQSYDGEHTHKGEWRHALDAILTDQNGRNFENSPGDLNNYYCYGKPVVAPADGTIANLVDNIDDNQPGTVNTVQNWGNTIVIRHLDNLYTQISHLKSGSIRVKAGDFVRKGDIIASCGNSGRSPVPHVHFQVQSAPLIGAKTIEYPISYSLLRENGKHILKSFWIPGEGDEIQNFTTDQVIRAGFDFQPGMIIRFRYKINGSEEKISSWEVYTDSYNYKYLYCPESQSTAWFVNDGTMFRFLSFNGNKDSLLYYFYLVGYKVLLCNYPSLEVSDMLPLHIIRKTRWWIWMHDFTAPFFRYIILRYRSRITETNPSGGAPGITIESSIGLSLFGSERAIATGSVIPGDGRMKGFTLKIGNNSIWAQSPDI